MEEDKNFGETLIVNLSQLCEGEGYSWILIAGGGREPESSNIYAVFRNENK